MALDLSPNEGPARELEICDLVSSGTYDVTWATITSDVSGHHAQFQVFADAMKVEGVRVNVCAKTEQVIAEMLNCMLLTPRLADLIWLQADCRLPPFPRGNIVDMGSTQAMIEHSAKIDAALSKFTAQPKLISTTGKHWTLSNGLALHPGMAENYGWHSAGPMAGIPMEGAVTVDPNTGHPIPLIQGRGWRHDMNHVDYSQICVLVSRTCTMDGQTWDLLDLLQDPDLAHLANHDGVLKVLRQPST